MKYRLPLHQIDWSNFDSSVIVEVERPTGTFTSTGVAINATTILTAAHSLEGDILKIRVFHEAQYCPGAQALETLSYELHPHYRPSVCLYQNDLAKITLKNPLPLSTKFYPIKKDLRHCEGLLWRVGHGGRNGQNARTLIRPLFKSLRLQEGVLELHDKYSVKGDSGGPILLQQNGQMYLLALHSTFSYGPEGQFSFNPLLVSHRNWIHASHLGHTPSLNSPTLERAS